MRTSRLLVLIRRLPCAALLIVLWAARAPLPAIAQSQGPGTVVLRDGSHLHGTILLYVPGQKVVLEREGRTEVYEAARLGAVEFSPAPAETANDALRAEQARSTTPSETALQLGQFRAIELARLHGKLEVQRRKNQRWQVPAVGLAVGVASILSGAFVLTFSPSRFAGCACDSGECLDVCEHGVRMPMARAGVVLIPVGTLLVVVNTPMLIVRTVRARRMRQTEATIRHLAGQLSFAPLLTPRGEAGFGARLSF